MLQERPWIDTIVCTGEHVSVSRLQRHPTDYQQTPILCTRSPAILVLEIPSKETTANKQLQQGISQALVGGIAISVLKDLKL